MFKSDFIIRFEGDSLTYRNITVSGTKGAGVVKGVTVIYGPNGSGKSTLGNVIAKGRHAFNNRMTFFPDNIKVKMLSFTSIHALTGIDVEHHTQRLEATANDFVPTVAEILGDKAKSDAWLELASRLGLADALSKKINYLSSGELRKLLVTNMLSDLPDLLVLDNPYIGLDSYSRSEFDSLVEKISNERVSIVMLLCDPSEIPDYADALIRIENRHVENMVLTDGNTVKIRESLNDKIPIPYPDIPEIHDRKEQFENHEITFEIRNGNIRYGDKTIIENFDWQVRRGECWALTGPNGSGKSLLLSLICADHPQAYSNDITLFDHRRGTGESIWDIKDAIGYVSPEMQLYFRTNSCVKDIVAKGKRNSLNRSRQITEAERSEALRWLDLIGISHIQDRNFSDLSNGEKQLVLLAAALIRQPRLLVLDEPFHGLDRVHKLGLKRLIEEMSRKNGMTLIFVSHYKEEFPDCIDRIKEIGCQTRFE